MPVPVERRSYNIIRTINDFIRVNISTPQGVTTVFQDRTFDVSGLNLWLDVTFLTHGAGRKGETLVQLDIYSRMRGDVPGGDQYGADVNNLADAIHSAFRTDAIQIYDHSVPASPVAVANRVLMVQNSAGKWREPETDTPLDMEEGVVRRSMVYRFRMPGDASAAPSYYD